MRRPRDLADVLAKIPGTKQGGNGWTAPCPLPGHRTASGHLSLKDAGDKVLVTCQGGRHSYQEIAAWLGFDSLTYSRNGDRSVRSRTAEHSPIVSVSPRSTNCSGTDRTPTEQPSNGLSLAQLAEAKKLPVEFLKKLGVSDCKHRTWGQCVSMPYFDPAGGLTTTRYRINLTGDRFRGASGKKVQPYGLQRLDGIKEAGWCLVVEGESDSWTAWNADIPCIGIPGMGTWRPEWASYLAGVTLYVWQEPNAEKLSESISRDLPDCRIIVAPPGIKDISEAHLRGIDLAVFIDSLKATAIPARLLAETRQSVELQRAEEQAAAVLAADDPLILVEDGIREAGYSGDVRPALMVYLSMTSRVLDQRLGTMPIHLLLLSPSSAGKSYTLQIAQKLLPAEAVWAIDASSPRTLIYSHEPVQYRAVVFGEADSLPAGEDNPVASAIRALLQDHRLRYEVTVKSENGDREVMKIDKPGPTVMLTTSTRRLGDQLMTRLFVLELPADQAQLSAAITGQADMEINGAKEPDQALLAYQSCLQARAPWKVFIPFADQLAAAIVRGPLSPRIMRDYQRLLSFVKVVAVLRHRQRKTDSQGRLVATIDDYSYIYYLTNEMYAATVTEGASGRVREVVDAVRTLDMQAHGEGVTITKIAAALKLSKSTVSGRVTTATLGGWLVNSETRKGRPARLQIGEPLPETDGLPAPATLEAFDCSTTVRGQTEQSPKHDPTLEQGNCSGVRPLTAGSPQDTPGIPCVKGSGSCTLRTDPAMNFQCVHSPQSCSHNTDLTPKETPDAQTVETPPETRQRR